MARGRWLHEAFAVWLLGWLVRVVWPEAGMVRWIGRRQESGGTHGGPPREEFRGRSCTIILLFDDEAKSEEGPQSSKDGVRG